MDQLACLVTEIEEDCRGGEDESCLENGDRNPQKRDE